MSASRATANAKLLQRHQRKQSSVQAKSSANKFTQKQSHFEQRREEEQVRQLQQHSGGAGSEAGTSAGDSFQLRSQRGAWGGPQSFTAGSAETPSPFALQQEQQRRGPAGGGAAVSTRSATLGLGSAPHHRHGTASSTRTTRRTARFNLSEGDAAGGSSSAAAGGGGAGQGLGSLLGTAVNRHGTSEPASGDGLDRLLNGEGDGEAEAPRKRTREERFREVMASSKEHRAQLQRDRAEREEQTKALDDAINGLLHLLPKRSKIEEEKAAFAASGTPEVRALLQKYKEGHTAKLVRLHASGAVSIVPLGTATGGAEDTAASASSASSPSQEKTQRPAEVQKKAKAEAVMDSQSRQLLAKIRSGNVKSAEELEHGAAEEGIPPVAEQPAPGDEDDFDQLLRTMRMDTRRAHAVERTLTAEEEEEMAAQQELLEADRSVLPSLGLQEKEMVQLTRAEWIRQGGDRAFHMDDDEGGADVYSDNVDLPSSYEGDSDAEEVASQAEGDASDDDGDEEGGKGGDDGDEHLTAMDTAHAKASVEAPIAGSATLDRLLSELEKIARSAVVPTPTPSSSSGGGGEAAEQIGEEDATRTRTQRSAHVHRVLTQLHRYAQTHVLEVANAFRLILIEAERQFLRGQRGVALSPPMLLYLYAISRIFPTTDYRHEVTTPFLLFLCSTLLQMKLRTLQDVHCYLVLAALLLQSLRGNGGASADGMPSKFAAEAVVAPLNVLALQLPRVALEPVRYQGVQLPIPLVERVDGVLLNSSKPTASVAAGATSSLSEAQNSARARKAKGGKTVSAEEDANVAATEATDGSAAAAAASSSSSSTTLPAVSVLQADYTAESLLLNAYRLVMDAAEAFKGMAAFPALLYDPFLALHELLMQTSVSTVQGVGEEEEVQSSNHNTQSNAAPASSSSSTPDARNVWQPSAAVRAAHTKVLETLQAYKENAEKHRTPLAMRTFRPRPLRQFEPLLAEQPESAAKIEIREVKREIREDKKRVMRHLTAEAAVHRRAMEKVQAVESESREKRYHQLMGQLQAQQHIMKTADAIAARGKGRPKKGVSGAPTGPGAEGDDS